MQKSRAAAQEEAEEEAGAAVPPPLTSDSKRVTSDGCGQKNKTLRESCSNKSVLCPSPVLLSPGYIAATSLKREQPRLNHQLTFENATKLSFNFQASKVRIPTSKFQGVPLRKSKW